VNTRITEDSERLCQEGIEQVHKVHRNLRTTECSVGEETPSGGR
jgi:hypothetical protein